MIEIITVATAHVCAACILLTPGGTYMRYPPAEPMCFSNGNVPSKDEWDAAEKKGAAYMQELMEKMAKGEPNGVEIIQKDGRTIAIVGKDVVDCRKSLLK